MAMSACKFLFGMLRFKKMNLRCNIYEYLNDDLNQIFENVF